MKKLFLCVDFNSYKVRYKQFSCLNIRPTCELFQFLQGKVQTADAKRFNKELQNIFQFLQGKAQTEFNTQLLATQAKFQFLQGKVQTALLLEQKAKEEAFQFLQGKVQTIHKWLKN
ncbi:hypothetical protein H17ap60334_02688 [Thermosipho africanus H17ap60334]|nr:hypothetical protein H17ap60334_02688 [Thermosipho africanus H17ap60334]